MLESAGSVIHVSTEGSSCFAASFEQFAIERCTLMITKVLHESLCKGV